MRALLLTIAAAGFASGLAFAAAPLEAGAIRPLAPTRVVGPAPGPVAVLVTAFVALNFRRRGVAVAASAGADSGATLLRLPVHRSRPRDTERAIEVPTADAA